MVTGGLFFFCLGAAGLGALICREGDSKIEMLWSHLQHMHEVAQLCAAFQGLTL